VAFSPREAHRALIRLGLEVAIFVRLALTIPLAVAGASSGTPMSGLSVLPMAFYAGLCALLLHTDLHRTRARHYFASLGISPWAISGCAALSALAVEALVHLALLLR
jgi:hypothetical protein